MVIIEEKALNAAREKNGSFVVKTIATSGGCCDMDVKDIIVELKDNFKGTDKHFEIFEFEGIKIFIEKYLYMDEHIEVYERFKLPLIGSIFKVKGVSVKYM